MSVANTTARLRRAKQLIKNKNYETARAILAGTDHPTAKAWLEKLDRRINSKSIQIHEAITVFSQSDWKVVASTQDFAQFEKKKGINAFLSVLLIFFLALLGGVIVAIAQASAGTYKVTVQNTPAGTQVTTRDGTILVNSTDELRRIAKRGSKPINIAVALFLGLLSSACYWYTF